MIKNAFWPNFLIGNISKLKETVFVFRSFFPPFFFASAILESSSRNFNHSIS